MLFIPSKTPFRCESDTLGAEPTIDAKPVGPPLQPGPRLILVVRRLVSHFARQSINDINGCKAGIDHLSRHGVHVGVDKIAGLGIRVGRICKEGL